MGFQLEKNDFFSTNFYASVKLDILAGEKFQGKHEFFVESP
jgi:hypothetical protein